MLLEVMVSTSICLEKTTNKNLSFTCRINDGVIHPTGSRKKEKTTLSSTMSFLKKQLEKFFLKNPRAEEF
jgi:hypothetical protein